MNIGISGDPFGTGNTTGNLVPGLAVPQEHSFSNVLASTGEQFVSSLQKAEAASIAGLKGEAGVYEVTSSVMEAEQNLRMTIAIRDRLVQAFLEISRMQI